MRLLMMCVIAGVLCGCTTPSLGPAYTDETIVHDNAYVGTWLDQDRTGRYTVSRSSGKGYLVRYERLDLGDQPFEPVEVDVVVFEVGGTRFIDAYPGESEVDRVMERAGTLFFPMHNFARLTMEGGVITIDLLDMGWVNDQRATLETAHGSTKDTVVLTADPTALQALLERAAKTPGAFSDDSLILERGAGGG